MKKTLEIASGIVSLLSGLLPWLEGKARLLPINPTIREDMLAGVALLAAVGGLASYMTVKHYHRSPKLGWIAVFCLTTSLFVVYLLASTLATFGLSAAGQAGAMRGAYLLVFLSIGMTVGGFLGTIGDEQ